MKDTKMELYPYVYDGLNAALFWIFEKNIPT